MSIAAVLGLASAISSGDRTSIGKLVTILSALLLVAGVIASLTIGASDASVTNALAAWSGLWPADTATVARDVLIVRDIRLPRIVTGAFVGAALAVSGAAMQGLFRNPLADPGIIGISSGASLGAVIAIVLGKTMLAGFSLWAGTFALPLASFLGALGVTAMLYSLSTRGGRTSITTLVLAGIAIGALAFSVTGLLIFIADEQQLRELTFWQLGSLAGSTWTKLAVAGPVMLVSIVGIALLSRGLNAIMLGEAVAMHLGISVQRLKYVSVILVSAATGAAVSISGGIGFIGIVVPHVLRLAIGPDYRWLIPSSACLGGVLLLAADAVSRTIVAPAELPVGIITALIGAPVFVWMLISGAKVRAFETMIKAENLGIALGRRQIIHGMDFTAHAGEITVILGQNGSGKTTLLRALTGEQAFTGTISLNGRDIRHLKPFDLARMRAVLPQNTGMPFPFTVREVVRLGVEAAGGSLTADAIVQRCLRLAGLELYGGRLIDEMSGGEQQRAHMARVLAQVHEPVGPDGPRWLFLDEPVSSLDLKHQIGIMRAAKDFAAMGGGVVAVLHDPNLAAAFADRIHAIIGGRTSACGPVQSTLDATMLSAIYETKILETSGTDQDRKQFHAVTA